MYQIEIHYHTGDSFSSEDRDQRIDFVWNDLEVAKENLRRIEEHYKMYQKTGKNYHAPYKEMKKQYGKEPWFVDASKARITEAEFLANSSLNLIKDDGTEFRYSTFWTGYFESLYGGSIVAAKLPSFKTSYY